MHFKVVKNEIKIFCYNSSIGDYTNKNFGYSKLYDIPPRSLGIRRNLK